MPFVCSICEEESTRICVRCTKDTCSNHLCEKCSACSDCCDCEIQLDEESRHETEHPVYVNAELNGLGRDSAAPTAPDSRGSGIDSEPED